MKEVQRFSVRIPYTYLDPTKWHPTEETGPFSVLMRGSFKTRAEAAKWVATNIPGHDYSIVPSIVYVRRRKIFKPKSNELGTWEALRRVGMLP
jgi:hypothetical protein